uniref:Tetraspanin n=1 Tax=Mola mola TaxID=94237 RepID=A0A3Q3W4A5_MOLML
MCCTGFLKTMMFIFNGGIFLAGAVILGVGIWTFVLLIIIFLPFQFFIIVLIIFLAEVAGAIVLFVFKDVASDLLGDLEDSVRKNIKDNYGKEESVSSLWNATMDGFKCCGIKNYTDFTGSPFNNKSNTYPQACCNPTITIFPCNATEAENSMIDGCFSKLLVAIEENAVIIAGVALGIAAIEIAAMVVSMVLYKDIGTKA